MKPKRLVSLVLCVSLLLALLPTAVLADDSITEQFTLTPGGTYYFDLSAQGVPGTVNTALPDTTLKWVPFTYAGTVNAYSRTEEGVSTTESVYADDRSLFVADYNVSHTVSWDALDNNDLIFGKAYSAGGVDYKLRSLSVGSSNNGETGDDIRGTPETNEWDQILNKDESYIKKWSNVYSWGQDTSSEGEGIRAFRGYSSARYWSNYYSNFTSVSRGWRPALEILNPVALGSDGLKTVTFNMDGNGTLGYGSLGYGSLVSATVVYTGALTLPEITAENGFDYTGSGTGILGWYDGSTFYTPETVLASLASGTTLTAGYSGTAPTITTTVLPNGTVGTFYSQTLTADGDTPIIWSIENGSLPDGLNLSGNTISGTPTTEGIFNFTVKAENGAGSDTQELSIMVGQAAVIGAAISPDTGSFDMYSPADIQTTITWNNASTVTDVVYSSASLISGTDYTVTGNALTIKKEYLAKQSTGNLVLTVEFDEGDAAMLTIDITDTTPPSISPEHRNYDLSNPQDVSTTITWNSAATVTDVVYGTTPLTTPDDYVHSGSSLTILDTYLSGLSPSAGDELDFIITFDTTDTATLTVHAVENHTPSADADLSDITVGGGTISGFDADITSYNIELPHGTLPGSAAALVNATANDPAAQVSITQASALPGSAAVTVTAEDGTIKVYTINFTIGTAPTVPVTSITVTGTGGASGLQVGNTLQMLADILPANATDKSVTWSIQSGSGASINSDGLLTATVAGSVTVRATANDGSGIYGEKIVTITATPTKTFIITATAGSGGSISPSGAVNVTEGSDQTFTITPNSGYRINSVIIDGVSQGAITTYTFTNVTTNHTINATFSRTSSGGGDGSSTPSTPSTPTAPDYEAEVKEGNGPETTLLVTVDTDAGTASIDLGSHNITLDGTVVTIPQISGVNTYSVGIPVPDLSSTDSQGSLTLNTDTGNITVPSNMLTGVSGISGSKAEISIGQGNRDNLPDDVQAAIGDRPLVQVTLSVDGEQTEWNNPDAPVTVSIPYTPTAEELSDPEHITVWYIDGKGNVVEVPSGKYDPATGMVTFSTTHFSNYAVVYVTKTFDDLGSAVWAKKPIEVLASKGILTGISEKEYNPQTNITRADFLYFLIRTLGVDAKIDGNFDDISSDTYYYNEIAIAKKFGITSGTGNNKFSPDTSITRQDMMVLTERALRMLNKLEVHGTASDLDKFADNSLVAAYAIKGVSSVVKEGLIVGSGGKVNPLGNTTRAEAAAFLYRVYDKY